MRLPDHDDRHAALTDFQHNLVITAGAGTGKTSLLVGRLVAALVLHHLDPRQVLALTFTENAANEMRERLIRVLETVEPWLTGTDIDASDAYVLDQIGLGPENLSRVRDLLDDVDALTISTFHGFCLNFLRENARALELPPDLGIGDVDATHPGFDEVFLECLREASEGEVHGALHRFDATELRDLAIDSLELPEDSLDRIADSEPPQDLEQRLRDLEQLIETYPTALGNWRDAATGLAACYRALIDGQRPASDWIDKTTPKAGKRKLGDASDDATSALDAHRKFLRPLVSCDQEGVALAVDFIRPVLRRYREEIAIRGKLGFQDLLLLTRQSLMTHADLRGAVANRLRAILVDEFQDTDPLQYDVIFLLAAQSAGDAGAVTDPMTLPLRPGTLFIVGDAKQSIYRFRRADVAAFTRAVQCIGAQQGRMLELTANFRSDPEILEFVNEVCRGSLEKDRPYQFGYVPVVPMRPRVTASGPEEHGDFPVTILQVDADEELRSDERRRREGNLVVQEIARLHAAGTPLSEIAILLRATTDTSWLLRPLRGSGIPYVLEGSRRFYQRQEVVLCRSLLGAIARPHDPVAVLAILRSSLSEATDADIVRFLASGQSLNYRETPGPADPGSQKPAAPASIADCFALLRKLHEAVCRLPIHEALTHLLSLPEFRLTEGAGFEGAQRLANIERLLYRLLLREPLDLAEAASFVAAHTDLETDDEESPLFDGGVEAVRILTVHKSKGLEFPVVFLPDVARSSAYRERVGLAQAQRLFDEDGVEMVTVRIGDTRNSASLLYRDAGRRHDEAEQRRLFYVAATRAKRRLFVVRGENAGNRKRLWQDDLEVGDAKFTRRLAPGLSAPRREQVASVSAGETLRAQEDFASSTERNRLRLTEPDLAPSRKNTPPPRAARARRSLTSQAPSPPLPGPRQLTFGFAIEDDGKKARPRQPQASRSVEPACARPSQAADAMEFGTAVHTYLALVDLTREDVDEALLAELPLANEIEAVVAAYHESELRRQLSTAAALHREVPLTFVGDDQLDDGAQIHGVVDLIVEEPDGSIWILDWKTDRLDGTTAPERAESYRRQLATYARGVRQSLELADVPRTAVHFVRDDITVFV